MQPFCCIAFGAMNELQSRYHHAWVLHKKKEKNRIYSMSSGHYSNGLCITVKRNRKLILFHFKETLLMSVWLLFGDDLNSPSKHYELFHYCKVQLQGWMYDIYSFSWKFEVSTNWAIHFHETIAKSLLSNLHALWGSWKKPLHYHRMNATRFVIEIYLFDIKSNLFYLILFHTHLINCELCLDSSLFEHIHLNKYRTKNTIPKLNLTT